MKATLFAIAASTLLSAAAAGPYRSSNGNNAIHDLKARDCGDCETVSFWKKIFGQAPLVQPESSSTSSVATTAIIPAVSTQAITSTIVDAPLSAAPTSESTSQAPSSSLASSSASSPPSTPSSTPSSALSSSQSSTPSAISGSKSQSGFSSNFGSSGQISTGGELYAMAYTPYKGPSPSHSRCAEADEVMSDIAQIAAKGFKTVRTYATDCGGLEHIGDAAKASGLKMIVGIYVDSTGVDSSEVNEQIHDIKTYFNGDYSMVEMVLLGNEALFNNFTSAEAMASKLTSLKQDLSSAGYNGPVSTADTLAELQAYEGTLCNSMDVLAANIHPFFNDVISAFGAGAFVAEQMQGLQSLCGGSKKVINSETGWPSGGQTNGDAIPSLAEQLIAIESIKQSAGGHSVFFSFENDDWKAPGYLEVEASWGCSHVF